VTALGTVPRVLAVRVVSGPANAIARGRPAIDRTPALSVPQPETTGAVVPRAS